MTAIDDIYTEALSDLHMDAASVYVVSWAARQLPDDQRLLLASFNGMPIASLDIALALTKDTGVLVDSADVRSSQRMATDQQFEAMVTSLLLSVAPKLDVAVASWHEAMLKLFPEHRYTKAYYRTAMSMPGPDQMGVALADEAEGEDAPPCERDCCGTPDACPKEGE